MGDGCKSPCVSAKSSTDVKGLLLEATCPSKGACQSAFKVAAAIQLVAALPELVSLSCILQQT